MASPNSSQGRARLQLGVATFSSAVQCSLGSRLHRSRLGAGPGACSSSFESFRRPKNTVEVEVEVLVYDRKHVKFRGGGRSSGRSRRRSGAREPCIGLHYHLQAPPAL